MDSFRTTSEAYLAAVATLLDDPDFETGPRGLKTAELMNWQFAVEQPTSEPIVTADVERNKVIAKYLRVEKRLYKSGERRASVWAAEASKFWGKIANDDGTINSNYGWLIFKNPSLGGQTPWEWARRSLVMDRDTRQAYMRIALPEHQRFGVKDQVCTLHLMFMFRDGKLHETAVMRSNDAVKGLVYDMPWFCGLLEEMAEELGEQVGTYTHLAHSLHLYESDRQTAERMVGR